MVPLHARCARGADEPDEISREVASASAGDTGDVPLLPGAARGGGAGQSLARRARLVLKPDPDRPRSSCAGLATSFRARVSSEEVGRGKPVPDVYLAAARRLGVDPPACAAVEDSTNGTRPGDGGRNEGGGHTGSRDFPPRKEALELADLVIDTLADLPAAVPRL